MTGAGSVESDQRPQGARGWCIACLASASVILTVTIAVLAGGLLPGEVALRDAILRATSPPTLDVAHWVNVGGTWRLLVPAALVLLGLSWEARRRWWLWAVTLVGAPLVGEGWQELVRRTRPHGTALGFPSGHATAAAAFAVVVVYFVSRSRLSRGWRLAIGGVAGAAVCAIGLARIVLQAHWPADVLGGFAIGAGCAAGAAWWATAHTAHRASHTIRVGSSRDA
jgi:membrane-associated phospholipid phosphatase